MIIITEIKMIIFHIYTVYVLSCSFGNLSAATFINDMIVAIKFISRYFFVHRIYVNIEQVGSSINNSLFLLYIASFRLGNNNISMFIMLEISLHI